MPVSVASWKEEMTACCRWTLELAQADAGTAAKSGRTQGKRGH